MPPRFLNREMGGIHFALKPPLAAYLVHERKELMRMKRLLYAALILGFLTTSVDAKSIGGVNLPNTLQAGSQELVLNGSAW